MWDIRIYALFCCVGLLGRWSYRAALDELDGELAGTAGLLLFWIPLAGVIGIGLTYLVPVLWRALDERKRGCGR